MSIDLKKVRQELDKQQAILLDVRDQKEWDSGHLKQAKHVPITELTKGHIPDLPLDQPIYTHCQKGGRAEKAAEILKQHYPNAKPLKYPFEQLKRELETS